jgi:tol-pal system protein YbgF
MKLSRLSVLALAALLGALPAFAQQDVLAQDAPPTTYPPPVSAPASSTYNETRLSALEDQLRTLQGRIEQVEFAVRRMDQTLQRIQNDNDARLTKLETTQAAQASQISTLSQPAAQPQPPQQQPGIPLSQSNNSAAQTQVQADVTANGTLANGTLGALKLQDGKVTGGVNNPQAPPLPATPPDYGLTPQEQYERAFSFLRQADYANAEQSFKSFIDKNPKDKLIDNAKYWYGETLYVRARFDEAAVAFADAYQQNPQGTKAPDSLLKLAMSLGALNKNADACVALGELKNKYKDAPVTVKSRAEEERGRLKCPAH